MTPTEIERLWKKLYPHRRAAYAAEFQALRAGTSLGEIERKRKRAATLRLFDAKVRAAQQRQRGRCA